MLIPKKLHHIWIGEKAPPQEWLDTWKAKMPDWEYTLWDNAKVQSRKWINEELMRYYWDKKLYCGVADLLRYEILNEEGGFIAEADSICLHSPEELFEEPFDIFTVYEQEQIRKGLTSPILASIPKHPFLEKIIAELGKKRVGEWSDPWKTTGNLFMKQMIEKYSPATLKIFPSYTFIPVHYTGVKYHGIGKIYAKQLFASTLNLYK